jgi:galactonate dehydratase
LITTSGSAPIAQAHWLPLQVTPKTCWAFIELEDRDGRIGVGEATLGGREAQVADAFERCRPDLIGRPVSRIDLAVQRRCATTLPEFAVVSALDQALHDLLAQAAGITVAEALGGRQRDSVAVYANVNRGITDRTPAGFAAQARRAVAAGFGALKIAPFDAIELYGDDRRVADKALFDAALQRIETVRKAIGPDVDLMVDCHWRLNLATAHTVVKAAEAWRLHWLECPVPERPELFGAMRSIRSLLNERGVLMAGCEQMSLVAGFVPFLDAGLCDVMMPDVKYVGGLREMLDVAATLQRHGVQFSPHNPSGPVCHAASLQICAAAAHVERLELQFDETPLFDALVGNALPQPTAGMLRIPDDPGLGVSLAGDVVQRLVMAA